MYNSINETIVLALFSFNQYTDKLINENSKKNFTSNKNKS